MVMDEAPKIARRTLVSEKVEIPRATVQGLIEAFRSAFRGPKVERLVYERGLPYFTVERYDTTWNASQVTETDDFLSAYHMIKQHAELEILDPVGDALESVARAVQSLTSRNFKLIMFVAEGRGAVREWVGKDLRIEDIWQVPLVEDAEAYEHGLFVCGSRTGTMIRDIEAAVFCRSTLE